MFWPLSCRFDTFFSREIFQRLEAASSDPSAGIVSYDEISLIDVFVARRDGASGYFNFKPSRSQQRRQQQRMKSNAMQNRDPGVHQTFIPRTQRPPKEQVCYPSTKFKFVVILRAFHSFV